VVKVGRDAYLHFRKHAARMARSIYVECFWRISPSETCHMIGWRVGWSEAFSIASIVGGGCGSDDDDDGERLSLND
jgi:hypothetical protein